MRVLMVVQAMADTLPPALTAARCMANAGAQVSIVAVGCGVGARKYLSKHGVILHDLGAIVYPNTVAGRACLRARFFLATRDILRTAHWDVLWFHAAHGMQYRSLLSTSGKLIVAHAHELAYGESGWLARRQVATIRAADVCITPEPNRAWLHKVESQSKAKFFVIPNRPAADMFPARVESSTALEVYRKTGGTAVVQRLLIYQGLIARMRCVCEIIAAFRTLAMPDVGLLLLGSGSDESYCAEVSQHAKNDARIAVAPRIDAPDHLKVTSGCCGGILLYAPTCLNNIYCAPNKIYEYAHFGIPMLMPEYPYLAELNRRYNLGELCDPVSIESIAAGMKRLLLRDIEVSRENARRFLSETGTPEESYSKVYGWLAEHVDQRAESRPTF
jgi:glycosyltransferase involved in cell wall biosynthesis